MDPTIFYAAITALLGGGLVTAVATYRKSERESESIVVRSVLEANAELRTELKRRNEEIEALRHQLEKQQVRAQELQRKFNVLSLEFSDLQRELTRALQLVNKQH